MKLHEAITGRLQEFIEAQPMFFVATAPAGADGHINISPKGLDGSFAVLDEHRVAYLDYGGSGAETIAHLRDNGRIVVMFCAFGGPPNIVRLHGKGRAHLLDGPGFAELLAAFPAPAPGVRAVIEVEVDRISDSCGYGVPEMEYVGHRDLLPRFWERKSPEEAADYRARKNAVSIDGLPAIPVTAPSTVGRVAGEGG